VLLMKECPVCHKNTLRVKMYVEFCDDDSCGYEKQTAEKLVFPVTIVRDDGSS